MSLLMPLARLDRAENAVHDGLLPLTLPEDGLDWALADLPRSPDENAAVRDHMQDDPLHLLYPDRVVDRARFFVERFRGKVLYAVKANPSPAVLRLAWLGGVRAFDVASIREVRLVRAVLPRAVLYFMHPVKSRPAIREAYGLGVRAFAFDGPDELAKIMEETGGARDLSLFLRMSRDSGAAAYDLSGKFGAAPAQVPALLGAARPFAARLGLCFHLGSQCMDPLSYARALSEVAALIDRAGVPVDALDVGGGFPVTYPGMTPPPLEAYLDAISRTAEAVGLRDMPLLCEPGRALVAEAGSVLARVEMRRGRALYLNDGTYGSLFDAGQPAWPFPVTLKPSDGRAVLCDEEPFELFGPTCDSLDHMKGPFYLPSCVREGDLIRFAHLGAYGQAMQTRFNGFYSDTLVAVGP